MPVDQYGGRKTREGTVVSDKPDKTVVVAVHRSFRHRLYKKIVRRVRHYMAHDETNEARQGDLVRIVESRPRSARKRWDLAEILNRAELPEVAAREVDLEMLGEVKPEEEEEAPSAPAEAAQEPKPEAAAPEPEAAEQPEEKAEAAAPEPEVAEQPEEEAEAAAPEPEAAEQPEEKAEAAAPEPEVAEQPEEEAEAAAPEPGASEETEAKAGEQPDEATREEEAALADEGEEEKPG